MLVVIRLSAAVVKDIEKRTLCGLERSMAGIQMRIVFQRRYSRMLVIFIHWLYQSPLKGRQRVICEDPIVVPMALKVKIDNIAGLRFFLLPSQSANSFCIKLVSLGKDV